MNRTNLLVDVSIFLAFIIAMEPRFSGVPVHEWLSVALAATVVVHLLLHWQWIVSVGGKFFRKLWHASRLKFVVDSLLFVAFVGIMMSGIMISKSFLPTLGVQIQTGQVWRQLHTLSADAGMLLVGLHFALSWNWIVAMLKRYLVAPVARLLPVFRQQPGAVAASHDEVSA